MTIIYSQMLIPDLFDAVLVNFHVNFVFVQIVHHYDVCLHSDFVQIPYHYHNLSFDHYIHYVYLLLYFER